VDGLDVSHKMKRLVPICLMLCTIVGAAEKPLVGGDSPDAKFRIVAAQGEGDESTCRIEVRSVGDERSVGSFPLSAYARFPASVEAGNALCVWSPDSKHFALMTRTTKRTWQLKVLAVDHGVSEVKVPDLTGYALKTLKQDSIFRWCRETPMEWIDPSHLRVKVAGDCGVAPDVKSYSGEVSVSIPDGKIVETAPFATKKEEG
jgi:hypothetical protein